MSKLSNDFFGLSRPKRPKLSKRAAEMTADRRASLNIHPGNAFL